MKIWVIGRGIPTKKNRMLGQFELGQAKMLSKGNSVSYLAQIFTYNPAYGTPSLVFKKDMDGDVTTYSRTVPFFPVRFHIHSRSYLKLQWDIFFRKVEAEDGIPDVIHVHYPAMICSTDSLERYRSKGVKIVCTEHWTKVLTGELDPFEREQLTRFTDIADPFICVGEPLKRSVLNLTGTSCDIRVVPNVVSDVFHPDNGLQKDDTYRFIALGRLVPVKQFDLIIDAFSHVFSGREDIRLSIVGNGSEYGALKQKIKDLRMEKQIELTGTLSSEEVAARVSHSDCLICYSRLETFGVPIIEGWASGLPVISSDCLGFAEYWNDDLGVIVSHKDLSQLESAMADMANNSKTYDPDRISEFARTHFGESVIRDSLLSIYSSQEVPAT